MAEALVLAAAPCGGGAPLVEVEAAAAEGHTARWVVIRVNLSCRRIAPPQHRSGVLTLGLGRDAARAGPRQLHPVAPTVLPHHKVRRHGTRRDARGSHIRLHLDLGAQQL